MQTLINRIRHPHVLDVINHLRIPYQIRISRRDRPRPHRQRVVRPRTLTKRQRLCRGPEEGR